MSKISWLAAATALLAIYGAETADAQLRAKAEVVCRPAGEQLQYDCVFKLMNSRSSEPLTGLAVTVGADMPSMAGLHNVKPVTATEAQQKGTYLARITLEMHGDWALRLDVSGAMRDRIIKLLRFEKDRVGESTPAPTPGRHRH